MKPEPEHPAISFPGVDVYVTRDGDRVTGRVQFPPIFKRDPIPIAYLRPPAPLPRTNRTASPVLTRRLQAVQRFEELRKQHTNGNTTSIFDRVAAEWGVCRRTVQLWVRRFGIEGESGLEDHYTPAPARVLTCNQDTAAAALLVCAWWSFRIANVEAIDTAMMHHAISLVLRFDQANILAAIDCYFAYKCDRQKYPFKRWSKWVRYDFETWWYRAADDADYRAAVDASKDGPAPLHTPNRDTMPPPPNRAVRDGRTRRRLTNNPATREAISALDPSIPRSLDPSPRDSSLLQAVRQLDDSYRRMLLSAARGDREASNQAFATIGVWWPRIPGELTRSITFRVEGDWKADHPGAAPRRVQRAKVEHFLAALKRDLRQPRQLSTTGVLSGV
jgi:hypothetical protein